MKVFHGIRNLLRPLNKRGGLVLSLALVILSAGCGMNKPAIKIYAVKYGESLFPEKFMYMGNTSGKNSKFTWLCYYVECGSRKILIDTGFTNQSYIKLFHITNYKRPSEILKQNGIQPEAITDIILTHGHFDHAGGISDYPSAAIIISSAESEEIKKGKYGNSICRDFINRGSITEFPDTYRLNDILTVKKIGGHTAGSSVVYLSSGDNRFCFTGDEIYSVRSLDENIPNGSAVNTADNTRFISEYNRVYEPLTFHNPEFYGLKKDFILIYDNQY